MVLLFRPEFFLDRLGLAGQSAQVLARSLASSSLSWGIGYGLVAADARRFRNFALLGALSKTIFTAIHTVAFFTGQVSFPAFLPALVDLLFAVLFIEFLWRSKEAVEDRR